MTEHRPDQAPAGAPPPPASRRRWIVILLVALVIAVGAYRVWSPAGGTASGDTPHASGGAAGAPAAPGRPRAVPVVAEPARSGDIRVYLDGLGACAAAWTAS